MAEPVCAFARNTNMQNKNDYQKEHAQIKISYCTIFTIVSSRKIWSRLYEDTDSKDHYTALLGVPKASRLDEGIYTCQVKCIL